MSHFLVDFDGDKREVPVPPRFATYGGGCLTQYLLFFVEDIRHPQGRVFSEHAQQIRLLKLRLVSW